MEHGVLMEFPFGQPVVKHSVLESENSGKEHHPGQKYRMHEGATEQERLSHPPQQ